MGARRLLINEYLRYKTKVQNKFFKNEEIKRVRPCKRQMSSSELAVRNS